VDQVVMSNSYYIN